jgi:hypothetical protein
VRLERLARLEVWTFANRGAYTPVEPVEVSAADAGEVGHVEVGRVMGDRSFGATTGGATAMGEAVAPATGRSAAPLRLALRVGAGLWLLLLVAGFIAPGGWVWGMAGPIGHIENYMISLWLVGLVLVPLLASRDPLGRTTTIQVYLLAVLAIVASTFRGEALKWIADGPPLAAAALSIGAVVAAHPDRSALLRR